MDLRNPREVLAEIGDIQIVRREQTSPAHDLAQLRWRKKNSYNHERYEKLINKKWRLKYSINYDRENWNNA